MFVIGTSGHVDHGKTKLIEALTGIDADRLPEEKQRGMTIDLGFAHFTSENGSPIGVIDVPGHERFIRNMVAGAWSLDCALLVVAADDGWMPQSTDHTVVLNAMGIKSIILVITKSDLADNTKIETIRNDALNKLELLTDIKAPSIVVSSKTGKNIDSLKSLIEQQLNKREQENTGFPYLFIDRVFNIKGTGTVITGSLKGGELNKNDELLLLPEKKTVRIRNIQSYYKETEKAMPVSRIALDLQGIKNDELQRGKCLTTFSASFLCTIEIITRININIPLDLTGKTRLPGKLLRNHSEVEIALGTDHQIAKIHIIDQKGVARIILSRPIAALWNQPFLIIQHGGSSILGTGRILWFGETSREQRINLSKNILNLPKTPGQKDFYRLNLFFYGMLKLNNQFSISEDLKNNTTVIESWIFLNDKLNYLKEKISGLSAKPGGISIMELRSKLSITKEALTVIYEELCRQNKLILKNDLLFKNIPQENNLSPFGKNILSQIRKTGKTGFEPKKENVSGVKKEVRNLVRSGLVVSLEGIIFYSAETYRSLVHEIINDIDIGSKFTISHAKEKTGLSRKYIIPMLNCMETDGYVKRDQNERIVINKLSNMI